MHSFSPFIFTWHGAQKGSDRFFAWPDPLSHLKRMVFCQFFNLYSYIFDFQHISRGYTYKKSLALIFSLCFHLAWSSKRL
ncbi:hypothetical protein FOS08_02940 [Bacillus pseudomycoides]|uniref:Uncharacterized protein n=1 Tax=Bacillus pseudomycoides TaxID=64104 RepID=A0AAJ1Z1U3_9BACI|nr:hypothetical protein [Bacillus pseudomycoides]